MSKLKKVKQKDFVLFINAYDRKLTLCRRNESVVYFDYARPSEHDMGTIEREDDSLVAAVTTNTHLGLPTEYFILPSNEFNQNHRV